MSGTIIPNSFQTPNLYIDTALALLTPEEWVCLSFAIRHILGWQDKINKRRGVISLTMFERGFITAQGTEFGGTGLTRAAIIKATGELTRFGLLIPTQETQDGQEYELGQSPNWTVMTERLETVKEANRQRTQKATAARLAKLAGTSHVPDEDGSSDVPVVVRGTNQGQFVGRTSGSTSDVLNQTHSQTQSQNQTKHKKSRLSEEEKFRAEWQKNSMLGAALLKVFGLDLTWQKPEEMPRAALTSYLEAAKQLTGQVSIEEISDLHRHVAAKAKAGNWSGFGVLTLVKYLPEWRQAKGAPEPEADVVAVSDDVRPLPLTQAEFIERAKQFPVGGKR